MKKKITLDDLAIMTQNGFNALKSELKQDILGLRLDIDKRFQYTEQRFDRIENLLLCDHRNRIERLEDRVQLLENKK